MTWVGSWYGVLPILVCDCDVDVSAVDNQSVG
jgi:hypothetical protein